MQPSFALGASLEPQNSLESLGPALIQGFLPLSCYFYSMHFLLLPTEGPFLTRAHNPPHVTLPVRTFFLSELPLPTQAQA